MSDLSAFLSDLARRRWQWGETDCLLVLADWIKAARGFDPAARFRGHYSDRDGAERYLMVNGGLLSLVTETLHDAGMTATSAPRPGDIAVVRAPCAERAGIAMSDTGAICVAPDRFAIFTPDAGVVIAPLPLRAAWRV